MLSRRNIRIKVLQQLYALTQQEAPSVPFFLNQLNAQFKYLYQFYYFQLQFLSDFNIYLESEKHIELEKYFPNKALIRNTQCIERLSFFSALESDAKFAELSTSLPYSWLNYGELFNRIFNDLVQYDFFIDYNVFDTPNEAQQKEFLTNLYEFLFNEFELFESEMEDIYILWNDDCADILKAIVKTIDTFYDQEKLKLEAISEKQADDFKYGTQLLEKCVVDKESLDTLIASHSPNWDADRLTLTDMLMLRMAVCEILNFETIPPKVTINEYLDIAKNYSTPKSHLFLNGVLDKIRIVLTESGKIKKTGRGLVN